ncbi:TonB-dependent receptor plug domain-containing protein [Puia sp. P3]|uniref:TonB-dependent receptor plug domain-containing protein n=1 Tax=Puia sp. P3 TaxID=3423952 RepID=UPI003D665694
MIGVLFVAGLLLHRVDTVRRDSLPEVTVRGYRDGGTLSGAISLQKATGLIVDIVPEESIQRSTDLSIGDVTRRINGLSVTTDNFGQSGRTIIRGMDPKYNYTLIDGIKLPSPSDRSRYIPLSIFPADMVQRVEVYKSLSPAMEGDAIGGAVNLVLRNAPSSPLLKVRFSGGYNQTFFDQSYLAFDRGGVRSKSPYDAARGGLLCFGRRFPEIESFISFDEAAAGCGGECCVGEAIFRAAAGDAGSG